MQKIKRLDHIYVQLSFSLPYWVEKYFWFGWGSRKKGNLHTGESSTTVDTAQCWSELKSSHTSARCGHSEANMGQQTLTDMASATWVPVRLHLLMSKTVFRTTLPRQWPGNLFMHFTRQDEVLGTLSGLISHAWSKGLQIKHAASIPYRSLNHPSAFDSIA